MQPNTADHGHQPEATVDGAPSAVHGASGQEQVNATALVAAGEGQPSSRQVADDIINALDPPRSPWVVGWRSWLLPAAMTLLGAGLRWPHLERPRTLAFDETYYAKDAYALLTHGVEWQWKDKVDPLVIAAGGNEGKLNNLFADSASYVVHPPAGKWVIALGEQLFGMTAFGWRFMPALLGTLLVLVVARAALRLTRSPAVAALAGFFLALDGMAIVLSRTAILDGILTFWIVCAAAALLIDRDRVRARIAQRLRTAPDPSQLLSAWRHGLPLSTGSRPALWLAGLCLGLALATKWSALWQMAFFALLCLAASTQTRRLLGITRPWRTSVRRESALVLVAFLLLPLAVYTASWVGWFATPEGYNRHWAATAGATGALGLLPPALRSWLHHHWMIWSFHVNLTQGHSYKANAWSWPIMGRPTSFWYSSDKTCADSKCAAEVLALGNPIIWWAGLLALLHQAWQWIATRDWRASVIVVGWLSGWVPWLLFQERTIFTFYAVIMVPFTCLALARSTVRLLDSGGNKNARIMLVTAITCGAVALTWFFLPVWTGEPMSYWQWTLRMWFTTWV